LRAAPLQVMWLHFFPPQNRDTLACRIVVETPVPVDLRRGDVPLEDEGLGRREVLHQQVLFLDMAEEVVAVALGGGDVRDVNHVPRLHGECSSANGFMVYNYNCLCGTG